MTNENEKKSTITPEQFTEKLVSAVTGVLDELSDGDWSNIRTELPRSQITQRVLETIRTRDKSVLGVLSELSGRAYTDVQRVYLQEALNSLTLVTTAAERGGFTQLVGPSVPTPASKFLSAAYLRLFEAFAFTNMAVEIDARIGKKKGDD